MAIFLVSKDIFKGSLQAIAYQMVWTEWLHFASYRLTFTVEASKAEEKIYGYLSVFKSIWRTIVWSFSPHIKQPGHFLVTFIRFLILCFYRF